MNRQRLFSSGAFAKLSRTTRDTLHLYDNIGLLPPASRGENNYRYYSATQLSVINMIRVLQELGMTLEEIIAVKDRRNPAVIDDLLGKQIQKIDKKIRDWTEARKLLLTLQGSIHSVLDTDETAVTIQFLPAAAIILGDPNDYGKGKDDYGALFAFYQAMGQRCPDLNLNYPVWGKFLAERIKRKDWKWPDRYYFYNPEGQDERPAALYAVGYARGGYGQSGGLFRRILDYIGKNGFEICGDAYEEYPLNEFCIADDTNYLIRILIHVREQQKDGAAMRKHGSTVSAVDPPIKA